MNSVNGEHGIEHFLKVSTLDKKKKKKSTDNKMNFFFPKETDFDISCKLSPMETICMKCQGLCSGKNKKNIINLLPV